MGFYTKFIDKTLAFEGGGGGGGGEGGLKSLKIGSLEK